MAYDTIRLMPQSLGRVLKRNEEALLAGVEAPRSTGGNLSAAEDVERRMAIVVKMVQDHQPFREIARELGELLRVYADHADPARAGAQDPRMQLVSSEYARFVEAHVSEVPLVYDRRVPSILEGAAISDSLAALELEASRSAVRIADAFLREGRVLPAASFDYRSVPFAEASLAYSRAITAASQAWLRAWSSANGDLKGAPFARLPPSASGKRTGKK